MKTYGFVAEDHSGVVMVWPAVRDQNGQITCYSAVTGCWKPKAIICFEEAPVGNPLDPETLLRCERRAQTGGPASTEPCEFPEPDK